MAVAKNVSGGWYETGASFFVRTYLSDGEVETRWIDSYEPVALDLNGPLLKFEGGPWLSKLRQALAERFGRSIRERPAGWELSTTIANEPALVDFRWNEIAYSGQRNQRLILADEPTVDLIVTVHRSGEQVTHLLAELNDMIHGLRASTSEEVIQPDILAGGADSDEGAQAIASIAHLCPDRRRYSTVIDLNASGGASEADLDEAERTLNVQLPSLLKELLRTRSDLRLRGQLPGVHLPVETKLGSQYGYRSLNVDQHMWFLDSDAEDEPGRRMASFVKLTGDGHANLCLDYRSYGRSQEPQICTVDDEGRAEPIADTFDELVSQLRHFNFYLGIDSSKPVDEVIEILATANLKLEITPNVLSPSGHAMKIPELPEAKHLVRVWPSFIKEAAEKLAEIGVLVPVLPPLSWHPDL